MKEFQSTEELEQTFPELGRFMFKRYGEDSLFRQDIRVITSPTGSSGIVFHKFRFVHRCGDRLAVEEVFPRGYPKKLLMIVNFDWQAYVVPMGLLGHLQEINNALGVFARYYRC